MNLSTQRRMAAAILKVGEGRVWFDTEELEDIDEAVTREDIRGLIKDRVIQAKQKKGTSRVRANFRKGQEAKGRRSGHGSRKGAKGARLPKKRRWISTIRPVRKVLKELRDTKKIDSPTYRKLYGMAKGGLFKSKAHLNTYLVEKKLIEKEVKPVKKEAPKKTTARPKAKAARTTKKAPAKKTTAKKATTPKKTTAKKTTAKKATTPKKTTAKKTTTKEKK